MINQNDLSDAAKNIVLVAFSDSHVRIDRSKLTDVLLVDFNFTGRFPTEDECAVLVMGDDEGDIPPELAQLFPRTDEFIGSHW